MKSTPLVPHPVRTGETDDSVPDSLQLLNDHEAERLAEIVKMADADTQLRHLLTEVWGMGWVSGVRATGGAVYRNPFWEERQRPAAPVTLL